MLPAFYLATPLVRANLVQGEAGQFADSNGSSRGLSNEIDLARLLQLRKLCDVLVTDGETARLESYRVPASCDLAVVTKRGFNPSASGSNKSYLELKMSPTEAITSLVSRGYERILLEVGPNVLSELIRFGLVDQLCLTNTAGSNPNLLPLGVSQAELLFDESVDDTRFTVWGQIQT